MGAPIFRVSDVLSLLFPGSLDFIREHHLERGIRCHESMEEWAKAFIEQRPCEPIYEECVPMVEWLQACEVVPERAESSTEHPTLNYHGHPDLIAEWQGSMWVIEYKFSEGLTEMNRIQMEAYCHLIGGRGMFLQCNKEGIVKHHIYKRDARRWAAFVSGLNVLTFIHHHRTEALCSSMA